MNFKILFIFFNSIFSTKNDTNNLETKSANNSLHLKTSETEKDIILSVSSDDYLPLKGNWHSKGTSLYTGDFRISGRTGVYDCLKINISCLNLFDDCFENFKDHVFELRTSKEMLENKEKLECRLYLVKKEDLQRIFSDYLYSVAVFRFLNRHAKGQAYFEALNNITHSEIICTVKFDCNSRKAFDFNKKIFVVNKAEEKNFSYEIENPSLKQEIVTIAKQNFLGAIIFGPCGFFLGLILAKYLLKRS
jgi:hypothetical protein